MLNIVVAIMSAILVTRLFKFVAILVVIFHTFLANIENKLIFVTAAPVPLQNLNANGNFYLVKSPETGLLQCVVDDPISDEMTTTQDEIQCGCYCTSSVSLYGVCCTAFSFNQTTGQCHLYRCPQIDIH